MKQKERYTPNEFIGLNEIEKVILEYKWIYRRQPSPDVGIDIQIEIVDDGYPTAKFIAVQVKKGNSNFYLNSKKTKASYYASPTHYEYWINSSIPVLVIGLLNDGNLYWQYASDKNLYEKLSESYRLDIPLNNKLNKENKDIIEAITLTHLDQLQISQERNETLNSILEYYSEISYVFRDFNETINNIINYIGHYTKRTNELGTIGNNAANLSSKEKRKVSKKIISKYTRQINALSNRLKSETNMSKRYFGELKKLMIQKRKITKIKIEDKILESFLDIQQYHRFHDKIKNSILTTNMLNTSIQNHPSYNIQFGNAQKNIKLNLNELSVLLEKLKIIIKEEIDHSNHTLN